MNAQLGIDIRDLGISTPVHPDNAGREWPTIAINRQATVELAANGHRPDVRWCKTGECQRLTDRGLQPAKPKL